MRPLLLTLLLPALVFAQCVPPSQDFQQWDGARLLRQRKSAIGAVQLEVCTGTTSAIHPLTVSGLTARDGVLFGFRAGSRGMPQKNIAPTPTGLYTSRDGKDWTLLATLPWPEDSPVGSYLYPMPLGEQRFLVKGDPLKPVTVRGLPFVLGVARVDRGVLSGVEVLDLGLDAHFQPPPLFSASLRLLPLRDRILVLHPPTGAAWLVKPASAGKVTLVPCPLFKGVGPNARPRIPFEHAVLAFRQERDGAVLLASRSESAIRQGMAREDGTPHPMPPASQPTRPTPEQRRMWGRLLRAQQTDSLARFSEVWWWRLEPGAQGFKRITTPAGAPAALPTPEALAAFGFSVDPQGRLQFRQADANTAMSQKRD